LRIEGVQHRGKAARWTAKGRKIPSSKLVPGRGTLLTWDGGDNLPLVEAVQDGGLSSIVEAKDQDPHLLGPEKLPKKLR